MWYSKNKVTRDNWEVDSDVKSNKYHYDILTEEKVFLKLIIANQCSSPTGAFSSHSLCMYWYRLSVMDTLYGVGFNSRLMSGRIWLRDFFTRARISVKDGISFCNCDEEKK